MNSTYIWYMGMFYEILANWFDLRIFYCMCYSFGTIENFAVDLQYTLT